MNTRVSFFDAVQPSSKQATRLKPCPKNSSSKCFLRTSYLVHGLERLLHQAGRHKDRRSPWDSRTNDGTMD